jgi:hypothetical protein
MTGERNGHRHQKYGKQKQGYVFLTKSWKKRL